LCIEFGREVCDWQCVGLGRLVCGYFGLYKF